MRDLSKMTTAEADAYRLGYADGLTANPKNPLELDEELAWWNDRAACASQRADLRCPKCNCWKMMREYCS